MREKNIWERIIGLQGCERARNRILFGLGWQPIQGASFWARVSGFRLVEKVD